jgi:hypothetical protein
LLSALAVSNLLVVVGVLGISIGLTGVGTGTLVACVLAVALCTILHSVAALRRRPCVVIMHQGFVFEKLFGREAHDWKDIDGQFTAVRLGWTKAVAFNLTAEHKHRLGKKPRSSYSGYDVAVVGTALPCSAAELAVLLNENMERNRDSHQPVN